VALAVCLLLDAASDRAVRRLWERLERLDGVDTPATHTHQRHVPHLSYAVLRTYDVDAVLAAVSALPPAAPVTLAFDAVALFPRRRAALVPAATTDLLARQAAVVEAARRTGADLHRHYRPGRWVPHCSIATGVRRASVGDLACGAFDVLPLTVVADRVALVDSATGEHWPLPRVV
jgi:2'-5' RNA ligase